MNEKSAIIEFNDALVDIIHNYVYEAVDCEALSLCNRVLVICSGVYTKIKNLINLFQNNNYKAELYFIGNKDIIDKISENKSIDITGRNIVINDKFKSELYLEINEKFGEEFDTVIFLCKYAIDIRDLNIIRLVKELNLNRNIEIFSYTAGEELNKYNDIEKYEKNMEFFASFIKWINECVL